MSLTGIFRAKDGITALVDSKASTQADMGRFEECVGREPEKLHPFAGGVLVVYGALQVFTENKATLFSNTIPIEQIIRVYLAKHHTIDAAFFQEVLVKMNSSPLNKEPVCFIVGRKIWEGKYQIEYHRVGYDYYAMRIGKEQDVCFVGGSEMYVQTFRAMDYRDKTGSVEALQKYTAAKLQEMIDFYDKTLSYNPVGGTVKSYILK